MVWGGISKRGTTDIVIFEGIMKSEFYQQSILEGALIPFIEREYPNGHRLMMDNDPKHTSKSSKAFMTAKDITWWPTPPESPDINPIEKLWKELKDYAECATTKDELLQRIVTFWEGITPEKCAKYIDHLPKVFPKIVAANGGAIDE